MTTVALVQPGPASPSGDLGAGVLRSVHAHPLASCVALCAYLALHTSRMEKLDSDNRFRIGVFPCKHEQL